MGSGQLSEEEIHDILSNRRRRIVLEALRDNGGSASARDLSEHIAQIESGESTPPRNVRQSAYVSLHQTHLPKLNQLDIVEYDDQSKSVNLTDNVSQLDDFMGTTSTHRIAWGNFYMAFGLISIIGVLGADKGWLMLDLLNPLSLAIGCLGCIVLAGAIQTYLQGRSIVTGRFGR